MEQGVTICYDSINAKASTDVPVGHVLSGGVLIVGLRPLRLSAAALCDFDLWDHNSSYLVEIQSQIEKEMQRLDRSESDVIIT